MAMTVAEMQAEADLVTDRIAALLAKQTAELRNDGRSVRYFSIGDEIKQLREHRDALERKISRAGGAAAQSRRLAEFG